MLQGFYSWILLVVLIRDPFFFLYNNKGKPFSPVYRKQVYAQCRSSLWSSLRLPFTPLEINLTEGTFLVGLWRIVLVKDK